jgi:hypothetical protein
MVVIGYELELVGDSNTFTSVTIPDFTNGQAEKTKQYELFSYEDDKYRSLGKFNAGEKINLSDYKVKRLKLTGIDKNLKICPADRGFFWQVTFEKPEILDMVRTPITEDLSAAEGLCGSL